MIKKLLLGELENEKSVGRDSSVGHESHMSLPSVGQLQAMNEMMRDQLCVDGLSSVMILGVAGGNGLEHIPEGRFEKVYGVDINPDYLKAAARRCPGRSW